jgi:endo-1,4-beta-D-glucanase Y
MGYGLLLTAYFGDRAEFDALWRFARRNLNPNRLLGWKVSCAGFDRSVGGAGSATDGDVDIALALVAAIDQWGDEYRAPALEYLAAVKAHDFTTCRAAGRVMATNGDWDKGCAGSNSSYWTPGYDRVFGELTHDPFWSTAAEDAIALWLEDRNATTGLIANAVNQDGTAAGGEAHVDYNGCRVPWRAALDSLWYGTAAATSVTDRITDWVDARGGPARLFDGYETDGAERPGSKWVGSDCFNGGYAVAAMSKSQERVDRFATYFMSLTVDSYYETSLRALYALMLSGNMWRPGDRTIVTAPPPAGRAPIEAPAPRPAESVRKGGCGLAPASSAYAASAWPWMALLVALTHVLRRRVACEVAHKDSRQSLAAPTRAGARSRARRGRTRDR